jgi:hypothetical protein
MRRPSIGASVAGKILYGELETLKNLDETDGSRAAERATAASDDWHTIPQRLAMIEQAMAGLAMALQNAASRDGVGAAIKEVADKIAVVESQLQALQSIVTENLNLSTRLDALALTMGRVLAKIDRLPSREDIARLLDATGRLQGALGVLGDRLGRLQWWPALGLVLFGAGGVLAALVLAARPG